MMKPLAQGEYRWEPERSATGPVTIMVNSGNGSGLHVKSGPDSITP
jgi:hypothetical protein